MLCFLFCRNEGNFLNQREEGWHRSEADAAGRGRMRMENKSISRRESTQTNTCMQSRKQDCENLPERSIVARRPVPCNCNLHALTNDKMTIDKLIHTL
jgi:hypothetical protein